MCSRFATHCFAKFCTTPPLCFVPFNHRHVFFHGGHRIFIQNYHSKRKNPALVRPIAVSRTQHATIYHCAAFQIFKLQSDSKNAFFRLGQKTACFVHCGFPMTYVWGFVLPHA